MSTATSALTIDVVSDVVCPWCYLGKKRLERALAQRAGSRSRSIGGPISSIRPSRAEASTGAPI